MLLGKQHLQAQISLLSYPRMRSPKKVAYANILSCLLNPARHTVFESLERWMSLHRSMVRGQLI
jgi:hypothetical protein